MAACQALDENYIEAIPAVSRLSDQLETCAHQPCPSYEGGSILHLVQNDHYATSHFKRKGKMQHPPRYDHTHAKFASPSPRSSSSDRGTNASKPYHCTACCKSFKDAYGWRRHESGVHGYSDTEWVCMLTGIITQETTCIFCSEVVNNIKHFDNHDVQKCLSRPICDRTFARKDLLKQHVQQVHLTAAEQTVSKFFQVPKAWAQAVDRARLNSAAVWCGFCLCTCTSVTERMEHVAEHFRNGHDIQNWIPMTTT
jgi:hypothetical protein